MQLVSDRWYKGFALGVIIVSALLLIGSAIGVLVPSFAATGEKFGLTHVTLGLSIVLLVYMLVGHRQVAKRTGQYGSTLILMFLYMLNVVNLIHSTGRLHSWYHALWLVLVAISGMFGAYMTLGFCFLSLLYLLLIMTDVPGHFTFDPQSVAETLVVFALAIGSYYVWRKLYAHEEKSIIADLSGKLTSSKQQSEILINSISDGIMLIGTDGKINLMNPAAAKMTEWPVSEAIGIDARTVLNLQRENGKPIDDADDPLKQALSKQERIDQVLQLVGRSKKSIIVSLVISPVVTPKSNEFAGAVAVFRDVSSSRAEEQRRADFISTASHEMRTPVAAIEGYLALALNEHVSQIDAKARSYLEKAHSSTQSLGKLFQDLLTSAKAEDGRLVSHPVVVEMGGYLEQLSDALRFAAQKKGLLVNFMIGADDNSNAAGVKVVRPLYYTQVDPDRMREVITNLFDNAVKYTESGKITLGLTGNTEVVQLSIKDTGAGIPAEDIPHLFQKFYRVDNTATRTIGGTGLGLFICRKIVELYKGRIWVESQVDQGSTFYINLPRLSAQKAAELQRAEAAGTSAIAEAVTNPAPPSAPAPTHDTITSSISS